MTTRIALLEKELGRCKPQNTAAMSNDDNGFIYRDFSSWYFLKNQRKDLKKVFCSIVQLTMTSIKSTEHMDKKKAKLTERKNLKIVRNCFNEGFKYFNTGIYLKVVTDEGASYKLRIYCRSRKNCTQKCSYKLTIEMKKVYNITLNDLLTFIITQNIPEHIEVCFRNEH